MARILVGSMPFISHNTPLFPIVRKLVERGHDVRWYTGSVFKEKIEVTGAQYLPMKAGFDFDEDKLGEMFPEMSDLNPFQKLKWSIKNLFIASVPGQVSDLEAILKEWPADVILTETTFGAAPALAERGGPPYAMVSIFPLSIPSRDAAPFGLGLQPSSGPLGGVRNQALNGVFANVLFRDVNIAMNKMRRSLGTRPVKNLFSSQLSPYLHLQGTTRAFEYPRTDLPPQVHFIGPIMPKPATSFTPPAWWHELDSGRPVALVTQGTVSTDPADLIEPALRALADTDYLVVATTGNRPVEEVKLNPLPANVRIEKFIPFTFLLPKVDIMVTNAGYGGVQQALAHGIPLVAAGRTEDKADICARIDYFSVGVDLRTNRPTSEQVFEGVEKVATDPSYRAKARAVAADFARHDAAVEASVLVEHLLETRRPVLTDHVLARPMGMLSRAVTAG